jgi:hypothetical protein
LKNLVTKFKPLNTVGLLAITDYKFTFCTVGAYPGNPDLGFSSLTEMDGGRFIEK